MFPAKLPPPRDFCRDGRSVKQLQFQRQWKLEWLAIDSCNFALWVDRCLIISQVHFSACFELGWGQFLRIERMTAPGRLQATNWSKVVGSPNLAGMGVGLGLLSCGSLLPLRGKKWKCSKPKNCYINTCSCFEVRCGCHWGSRHCHVPYQICYCLHERLRLRVWLYVFYRKWCHYC
jgi:hypothetical protein